jgi:hypothetical protein
MRTPCALILLCFCSCAGSNAASPSKSGVREQDSAESDTPAAVEAGVGEAGKAGEPGDTEDAGGDASTVDTADGSAPAAADAAAAGGAGSAAEPHKAASEQCATQTVVLDAAPVDLFIMLDRSKSMLGSTASGETKWDVMRGALSQFITDPRSAGLSIGLQYFPIGKPGVPFQCVESADCGSAGPCMNKLCRPSPSSGTFVPTYCLTDADCPASAYACEEFGMCEGDRSIVCFDFAPGGCARMGNCLHVVSECRGFGSCDPDAYANPEVAIRALPENASALTQSLAAAVPVGLTPIAAALEGAHRQLAQRAAAEPTHRVAAVISTDGLGTYENPYECNSASPEDVALIAQRGRDRAPAISTYVIAALTREEASALPALDSLAMAGGTEKAFIVDPTSDLSAAMLRALEQIRGEGSSCEYVLSPAPPSREFDLDALEVAWISPKQTIELEHVAESSACDDARLAWHYDAPNGAASKIVACPETCKRLRSEGGRAELRLACKP